MTLGEKIQALRKQSGMSQEQLAERITISRQAISRWELNESIPDADNIVQLSRIFGVSTDYLLKKGDYIDLTGVDYDRPNSNDSADTSPGHDDFDPDEAIGPAEKTTDLSAAKWRRGPADEGLGPVARVALFFVITSPAIYLIIGFWFGWWHPGWLVFILSALLFAGAAATDL